MNTRHADTTPLGAVARGALAGLVGTGAMTLWQELSTRLQADETSDGDGQDAAGRDPWQAAPAPARVARRVLDGLFGVDVPADRIRLLTNVTHWAYGTAWGTVYGIAETSSQRRRPLVHGLAFGACVWTTSYLLLVPMKLYEPPWRYPPKTLALDASYHLVYGAAVGVAHATFDRR